MDRTYSTATFPQHPCPKSRKPEVSERLRTTPNLYPELKVCPTLHLNSLLPFTKLFHTHSFDLYNFMRLVDAVGPTLFLRGEKIKAPKRLEERTSLLCW